MFEISTQQMISVAKDHAAKRDRLHLSELALKLIKEPSAPVYSPLVISGLMGLIETALIFLCGLVVYWLYVVPADGFSWNFVALMLAVALGGRMAFQMAGLYQWLAMPMGGLVVARLWAAWSLLFLLLAAALFLFKVGADVSRVWLMTWYFVGGTALLVGRMLLSYMTHLWTRAGMLRRRTVIVGGGEPAESLINALDAWTLSDLHVLGVFDDRDDTRSAASTAGVPKLGTVDELLEFARQTRIDLVIVTLPMTAEERVMDMLRKLWVLPVDIRLSAHSATLRFHRRAYSFLGPVPVLDLFDKPMADWDVVAKWMFDKCVGLMALVLLSPVFAVAAIAIKLDSKGPVFFRQKRYGFNNELVEVFKFRSMYVEDSDHKASKLVTRDDPRVTRVGRFLRRTSIDELPQLLNVVFFNTLSLVGPRPHAIHAKAADELYANVVDGYFARHKVKPGITGWAQINGWRGETDTEDKIQKRVEHDLYYIENWSIWLDLYILARTPVALALQRENAY